jgi:hypothetical protein
MAFIFTTQSFGDITVAPVKQGATTLTAPPGDVPTPTPIVLPLSDGTTSKLFDRVATALRCMAFMSARSQWMLSPTDDVGIALCADKGIIAYEQSLCNQKLFASFLPTYQSGRVLFAHRTLSQMLPLDKALESVGFPNQATAPWSNNSDLAAAHMVLVEINFPNSLLVDSAAIVYGA